MTEFCFSTPAHHHAEVLGLDHDRHARRMQRFHQRVCHLHGELLLNLQPAGEDVDDARDFGKADHFAVRDVGDVRLAR